MIETKGLSRKYGDLLAVNNLDLEVKEGEVFALLGPNGAGKTTTVRMLSCLIAPTSGKAYIDRYQVGVDNQQIRKIIGVLPENHGLYNKLSAWDNLEFFANLYGLDEIERRIEKYLDLMGLMEDSRKAVGTFSKGMRQKVAIARALINEPRILFLDEPTANLDPKAAKLVREAIEELSSEEKRTVVLCTHNLSEAERLCDRIGLLNQRLVRVGSPSKLKGDLYEEKTEIQLSNVSSELVDGLDFDFITNIKVESSKIILTMDNPEKNNPVVIDRIVRLGGKIRWVTRSEYSLEDVYLELMDRERNDQ